MSERPASESPVHGDAPVRRVRRRLVGLLRETANALPGAITVRRRGVGNHVVRSGAVHLRGVTVTIDGNDNEVVLGPGSWIRDSEITIRGSGNIVVIGASRISHTGVVLTGDSNRFAVDDGCTISALAAICEDSGNRISVGAGTEIAGATGLAAIEGTTLSVGSRCLFSGGIHVRTGDSHSVTDLEGRRTNPARDVAIGDHVWVGMNVLVLKGATIPDSCVVGAGAVVTRSFEMSNCAIGGNPAGVIKQGIDWTVARVPCAPTGFEREEKADG